MKFTNIRDFVQMLSSPCAESCHWETVPPQWGGGRLVGTSAVFFFTKTVAPRKIDPKVPNRPSCYKQSIDEIRGLIAKNGFSGQKPSFKAQKRIYFLIQTMFWPRPGKVVQKKSTLLPNKYQSFSGFRVFFFLLKKSGFSARFPLFGRT